MTNPPARGDATSHSARAIPWPAMILCAVVAFTTSAAAIYFTRQTNTVSVIWPVNAFLVAIILRSPHASRAPLLLAGWVGVTVGDCLMADPLPVAALLGLCNMADVGLSTYLLSRLVPGAPDLTKPNVFFAFILTCGGVGPAISASAATLVLTQLSGMDAWPVFHTWFASGSLGVLTISPLLLMLRSTELAQIVRKGARAKTLGFLTLVASVSIGTFAQDRYPLLFAVFPFLILTAFDLRFAGAAIAMGIVAATSIAFTLAGHGPLALATSISPEERIVLLQIFLASGVLTILPVAAVLAGRRQLEREAFAARGAAERANAAKSAFLTNMSHELRTPMTGILGMCDLLLASKQAPEQRTFTETLERSARSFLELLNDLLDLAKIEAGRMDLESVDFRVSQLMKDVQEFFAPAMSQKGLAFGVHFEPGRLDVLSGDAKRLRQILFNLVGNALKFTAEGSVGVHGRLDLQDNGMVLAQFEVRDTGIGMSTEAQARLFRPFEQEDSSTSRRFGGTGLGLNISKQIAEAMGGTISVHSVQGRGSTFSFQVAMLPGIAERIEHRYAITPVRTGDMLKGHQLKILYAEDNATTQMLVREVMSMWGHAVDVVDNGDQAVVKARGQSYDLILMDMQMPVLDGTEATRAIRAGDPPMSTVPIIALTADAILESRARYLAAGCDAVVTKPIEWSVLAREIKAVIGDPGATAIAAGPATVPPARDGAPVFDRQRIDGLEDSLAPAQLASLLVGCLAAFERYYGDLDQCLAQGNLARARSAAHDLKSVCGQFGALRSCEIARSIEAELPDIESMRAVMGELRAALDAGAAAIQDIQASLPADRSAA